MDLLTTSGWEDYELLDTGNGKRLERFGKYILSRPDPQIIWKPHLNQGEWQKADAIFERTSADKGNWIFKNKILDKWLMKWQEISFWVKLSPFKHTGVFPEQEIQWKWIVSKIESRKSKIEKSDLLLSFDLQNPPSTFNHPSSDISILNLFGYTGIASLVAANAGAKVTHVDASKPTITWARENQLASNLQDKPIRWILDDCIKFCQREIKRGVKYDGIIMDPPAFGHGIDGQIWKFNEHFPQLLSICRQLLSDNPLFIIVNAYAISSSALMLQNVLQDFVTDLGGEITVGELALQEKNSNRLLSTGIFARWS